MKNLKFIIYLLLPFSLYLLPSSIHAQSLGLSITPPISEIMIVPGKEVTQTFTISNDGEDGMASIYVIPFSAQGEDGGVVLNENKAVTTSSPYAPWFSIISPVKSFGEKFYIPGKGSQEVVIKISPPATSSEKDYYFTLLYELNNEVPGSLALAGPTNQARIGSNILLSLSRDGNPPKKPIIKEFLAPLLIDSLGKLNFNIKIANYGSYFFKSEGEITIKPTFGANETLKLAPYNVISDSVRNIPCLNGEEVIPCQSSRKVLVGIYKSTLSVKPDAGGEAQTQTTTTIAFPFSIVFAILFILLIYRIIKKSQKVGRETT